MAALLGDPRERADDVISLEPFDADNRNRERLQHLADHVELGSEVVGHGAPPRLVLDVLLGTKGRRPHVECCDGELRARGQDDRQHRRKAVDGVGHPAVRRAHRRQCEERPVDETVGVDQYQAPPSKPTHSWILRLAGERHPGGRLNVSNRRGPEARRV